MTSYDKTATLKRLRLRSEIKQGGLVDMTVALITAEGLMARLDYRVRRTWRQAGLFDEGWSNIIRHCVAVAAAAMVMAEKMLLPSDELDLAVDAALVHDAYKRLEVEAKKKAKAAGEDVASVLDQMAYQ